MRTYRLSPLRLRPVRPDSRAGGSILVNSRYSVPFEMDWSTAISSMAILVHGC
jgi:hypothetical protein